MPKYISILVLLASLSVAAIAQPSKTSSDYYNDGLKLINDQNYKEALTAFENAINKNPGYGEALYEAGWCCNELEKYAEALTYLQKAKNNMPPSAKIYFELAYASDKSDQKDEAITNYKKALELYPQYYNAARNLGDIYYGRYDYANAFNYYKQYLQTADADNSYYYKTGWCANDAGYYTEAISFLKNYEPSSTDDKAKKFAELGYANFKLQNNDEAITAYKYALDIKPNYTTALKGIGDVYYTNTRDYQQALKYFEMAINNDEQNSKAYYYKLGWLYNDAGRYADAVSVLNKAIIYDESAAGNREELGYAYYMQTDNDAALVQLKKAVELNPKSKLGYYYMGLCYIAMNQKEKARDVYEKLKDINEEQANKLLNKINGN